jgi:hypothetical protein
MEKRKEDINVTFMRPNTKFGHMDLMKYFVLSYSNYLRSNTRFGGGDPHV